MSLEIDWDSITNDVGLKERFRAFLNSHIENLELPSYLDQLNISTFSFGNIPPEITIRHVGNPFKEFYADDDTPSEADIQFIVEFNFQSDLYLELETNLLLNYPSTKFISLPIKLKFTELAIHSLAAITTINKRSYISFLCDVEDKTTDEDQQQQQQLQQLQPSDILNSRSNSYMGSVPLTYNQSALRFSTGSTTHFLSNWNTTSLSNQNNNRIDIIKKLKIESELGESKDVDGSILRNIGKIEKFLIEMLKDMIITELAWPSWLELDFNEEVEESDENDVNDTDTDETNDVLVTSSITNVSG